MPVLEEVLKDAMALTDDEREILAAHLVGSLDEPEEGVEEAWREELLRRRDDIESGRVVPLEVSDDLHEIFDDD